VCCSQEPHLAHSIHRQLLHKHHSTRDSVRCHLCLGICHDIGWCQALRRTGLNHDNSTDSLTVFIVGYATHCNGGNVGMLQ
jgi:hypothetical protein